MVKKAKDLCGIAGEQNAEKKVLFQDPLTGELKMAPFPRDIPQPPLGFKVGRIIYNQTNPNLSGIVIVEDCSDERYVLNKDSHTGKYFWS